MGLRGLIMILIKSLFLVLGGGTMVFSSYIPYKLVQPTPSKFIVIDKISYINCVKRLIFIIGVFYVVVGLLYIVGYDNPFFIISIQLIPTVLLLINSIELKKYYKKIE